jgi:hypothetical protein
MSNLEAPAPGRTPWHRARGRAWWNLTRGRACRRQTTGVAPALGPGLIHHK